MSRWVREVVGLQAARAPRLERALKKIARKGGGVVLLDGSVIRTRRRTGAENRKNYSGKSKCHGLLVIALTDDRGRLVWVSAARPGRTSEITACRRNNSRRLPLSDGVRAYAGGVDDRQADFIGLSLVEQIRAWQQDELPQLRTMLGNFVGNNATYAIIELYDAEGRLVDRSTGLYLRGGTRHAEIDALDQLALKQAHGGHAVIAINRPPCGRPHGGDASQRNCDDRITDLLRFHQIRPHVYLTPHATDPTVRPGTADPVVLAPRGRWTHAAAGRSAPCRAPLSLQRSIDPAGLRDWLLDQEIYRLRRHAQADPARAADPALARIREAFEQEALRRSAEHVVTRALPPATGAWREVELLPIVAPELPRGMARSTDPHHRGFLRTPQYDLVPYVPAPGARQAGYYLARNRQTGVDEWAIAPNLVEEFARGSAQHRELADFLMERLRSEWDIESMRSLRHIHQNRPGEAFDAWLRAWRAAFTSPAWLAEHALELLATLSRLNGLARGSAAAGRTGVRAVVGAAPAAEHLAEELADAVRAALHVHDATAGPSGRSHKDSAPQHIHTNPHIHTHTHSDDTPAALPQSSGSDFLSPGSVVLGDSAPAAFAQTPPDDSHGPGPASPEHTGTTGTDHAASAQSTDHHSTALPTAAPGPAHTAGTDQAASVQTTPDDSHAMASAAPGHAEATGIHPHVATPAAHGPGDTTATGQVAFVQAAPDHSTAPPPSAPVSDDSSATGTAGSFPTIADEPRTGTDTGEPGGAAGSSGGLVQDEPGATQDGEAGPIPADPGGADAAAAFTQTHFPWTEFRDDAGNLYAIQDELGRITYNETHQETSTDGNHGHGDWFAPPAAAELSHAGPAQADPALQALLSHLLQVEGMAPAAGSGASFLDPGLAQHAASGEASDDADSTDAGPGQSDAAQGDASAAPAPPVPGAADSATPAATGAAQGPEVANVGGSWFPVISVEKAAPDSSATQPTKSEEETAQQPSASSDGAQAGHHLPGADFGAISFDFDGGLPHGPVTDAGADSPGMEGAGAHDGDAGACGFESLASFAPPGMMA